MANWTDLRHRPIAVALMALITVSLIATTAWRIQQNLSPPGTKFDWENRGLSDFHNGVYFPTRAFFDGASPYSAATADKYSVSRAAPPFSPIVFVLHIPFAVLPLTVAQIAYFLFNVVLLMVIAYCGIAMSWQRVRMFDLLAITNLLLVSRPGHITLFTGYFTAEIVIGCVLAIHFAKNRPVVSGLGMVLASIKPHFIIPLLIAMIFRRNYRAVLIGVLLCATAAGLAMGWLVYHNGLQQSIEDFRGGQTELHTDPTELPVNSWTRVDLLGMIAKMMDWAPDDKIYLAFMLVFISFCGLFIYRAVDFESNSGATGLTSFIVLLAVLIGLYHQSYDCLVIAVPAIGVMFYGQRTLPDITPFCRTLLALLVAIPAVNYVSTQSVMGLLRLEPLSVPWQAVTLINGTSLLLALLIMLASAARLTTARKSQ